MFALVRFAVASLFACATLTAVGQEAPTVLPRPNAAGCVRVAPMRLSSFTTASKTGKAVFRNESFGRMDSESVSIANPDFDEARLRFDVTGLAPNTVYQAEAYVKGANIVNSNTATPGAGISAYFGYDMIGGVGSFNWQRVVYTFRTDRNGTNDVFLHLGFLGNPARGQAWFDDFCIKPFPGVQLQSDHIRLNLHPVDVTDQASLKTYADMLARAYWIYAELTGFKPFEGQAIDILFTNYISYWAVAGNPILVSRYQVREVLDGWRNKQDSSFGVLHELGHDFDLDAWNFNAEFWANTKMAYVIERLNLTIYMHDVPYTGRGIKEYYRPAFRELSSGKPNHDGLTYIFLNIRDRHGWALFQKTFAYFRSLQQPPQGARAKFERFIAMLSEFSGVNVRQIYFTQAAWQATLASFND